MWEIIGKFFVTLLFSAIGWSIVKGLYGSFIASALGLSINFKKTGKWAVVTGSTDGIGKAYAFEMARQGLNVVLISRTPFKLQNVSSEILSKYNVETKIIDVDFTKTDIYPRIEKEIAHLDIGVLINNVGMNYDVPEYFTDISADLISNLITCNMLSLTMMTKIVLPGMQERNRGIIINVSSLSSIIPAPFLAVYGATKAYVTSFSRSLQQETRSTGLTIQCVTPGYVVSNMSGLKRASLMSPTAMAYVKSSLKTAGTEVITGGYFMHKLQIHFIELGQRYLPGFILTNAVFNSLNSVRIRAMRKRQKMMEAKAQ